MWHDGCSPTTKRRRGPPHAEVARHWRSDEDEVRPGRSRGEGAGSAGNQRRWKELKNWDASSRTGCLTREQARSISSGRLLPVQALAALALSRGPSQAACALDSETLRCHVADPTQGGRKASELARVAWGSPLCLCSYPRRRNRGGFGKVPFLAGNGAGLGVLLLLQLCSRRRLPHLRGVSALDWRARL